MNKLILFDIDSTLITAAKAWDTAFDNSLEEVYGIKTTCDIINHAGMTEKEILLAVLKKEGFVEKEILCKMKEFEKVMTKTFDKLFVNEEITILGGVEKLLDELKKKDILLGLVTGNTKPISKTKLERTGIYHYFKVGGFAEDAIKRSDLVKIAIRRAEELGFKHNKNVFLIGDSPWDVKAGREVNVVTIAVTTGSYTKEDVKEADHIVENLKDIEEILRIIK
ncbi:HAD family hydrolase [Candidatus Aenigmatarchaeota archaeon]